MGSLLGSSLFRTNIILIKTKSDHLPWGPAILESESRLLLYAAAHRAPWRRQVRTLTVPEVPSANFWSPSHALQAICPWSHQSRARGLSLKAIHRLRYTDVAGCEGVWWGHSYHEYLPASQQPGYFLAMLVWTSPQKFQALRIAVSRDLSLESSSYSGCDSTSPQCPG